MNSNSHLTIAVDNRPKRERQVSLRLLILIARYGSVAIAQ